MDRRTFLASATAAVTGLSGCLGDGGGSPGDSTASRTSTSSPTPEPTRTVGDESSITEETDGYPSDDAVESTPESREIDTGSFETLSVGGVDVPLVPVDVAHYWHQRREARFADARGEGQYDQSHISGAVLSSARNVEDWAGSRDGDPTVAWQRDDRIVCYCGCPHHLSSLRAGEFIRHGYEQVYAIDEGFFEWRDLGYPVTGDGGTQASYVVQGRTDPSTAGKYAWASHEATDQQEAAPIADDGSYRLELRFRDVDVSTPIHLRTPTYELTAPLSDLTGDVVTGSV